MTDTAMAEAAFAAWAVTNGSVSNALAVAIEAARPFIAAEERAKRDAEIVALKTELARYRRRAEMDADEAEMRELGGG